jgi:hypothetical protein
MPIKRNDRHDVDRVELILIRVGQHIAIETRKKGLTVSEKSLLWEAASIVCGIKRKYRLELAERRRAAGAAFAAKMRSKGA